MTFHPQIFEINTAVLLDELRKNTGRNLTLSQIPSDYWQNLKRLGMDYVWLMGLWQRSLISKQKALEHPGVRQSFNECLPNWNENHVSGSPYAIYRYELEPAFGTNDELKYLKTTLNSLGLKLIVDFVPNHLAIDAPWLESNPDYFILASPEEARGHPGSFFQSKNGQWTAHGRDPNFPSWTDTAQLNLFNPNLQKALLGEVLKVTALCDGLRCDMAMLCLNEVFVGVWGWLLGSNTQLPKTEFWSNVISAAKNQNKDFIFIAEAYWGLERKLTQLGFDFAYDKSFYDVLKNFEAVNIYDYLITDTDKHAWAVRFIENHDEQRAVQAFGKSKSRAAALAIATLPGMRFFHMGQFEGRTRRIPVQLNTGPEEPVDTELMAFYERLLLIVSNPAFKKGEWEILSVQSEDDEDPSYENLLAWKWSLEEECHIVITNYSDSAAKGQVFFQKLSQGSVPLNLESLLSCAGNTVLAKEYLSMRVRVPAWGFDILRLP